MRINAAVPVATFVYGVMMGREDGGAAAFTRISDTLAIGSDVVGRGVTYLRRSAGGGSSTTPVGAEAAQSSQSAKNTNITTTSETQTQLEVPESRSDAAATAPNAAGPSKYLKHMTHGILLIAVLYAGIVVRKVLILVFRRDHWLTLRVGGFLDSPKLRPVNMWVSSLSKQIPTIRLVVDSVSSFFSFAIPDGHHPGGDPHDEPLHVLPQRYDNGGREATTIRSISGGAPTVHQSAEIAPITSSHHHGSTVVLIADDVVEELPSPSCKKEESISNDDATANTIVAAAPASIVAAAAAAAAAPASVSTHAVLAPLPRASTAPSKQSELLLAVEPAASTKVENSQYIVPPQSSPPLQQQKAPLSMAITAQVFCTTSPINPEKNHAAFLAQLKKLIEVAQASVTFNSNEKKNIVVNFEVDPTIQVLRDAPSSSVIPAAAGISNASTAAARKCVNLLFVLVETPEGDRWKPEFDPPKLLASVDEEDSAHPRFCFLLTKPDESGICHKYAAGSEHTTTTNAASAAALGYLGGHVEMHGHAWERKLRVMVNNAIYGCIE